MRWIQGFFLKNPLRVIEVLNNHFSTMSKKSFTEKFPSKNTSRDNAPIVFLVGTSTAGKSTICDEILRQDDNALNCKI